MNLSSLIVFIVSVLLTSYLTAKVANLVDAQPQVLQLKEEQIQEILKAIPQPKVEIIPIQDKATLVE